MTIIKFDFRSFPFHKRFTLEAAALFFQMIMQDDNDGSHGQNADVQMSNLITLGNGVFNKRYLESFREGRLACPVCYSNVEDINLSSCVQYSESGGLTQHLRVRHGGLRNGQSEEDVILSARKLTEGLVAKETLKNLQALSRLRLESDPNCRMYHKMTVSILNVPYEVLNIELYCTEEEEATKLICLYLLHKNKIRPLVERERPVSIGVKRELKEIHFNCWVAKKRFYLETNYCRLVSIAWKPIKPGMGADQAIGD